tara:strand:- start:33 stop:629 length:597 start_codon:yes stop_codon:yes gene_type:complete
MAYPTVSAPYGLKPVGRVDGMPYAGATRQVQIASGYAANIFNGDLVQVDTNGQCIVSAVTTSTAVFVVGVFLGCTYTNPSTKQKLFAQYWPTGTVASDAFAIIVDDPMAVFKVAVCSTGVNMATLGRDAIGSNVTVLQTAGSTATGDSNVSVLSTSPGTTATVLRVIDVVTDTAPSASTFSEVLVKINNHQYNSTTGI